LEKRQVGPFGILGNSWEFLGNSWGILGPGGSREVPRIPQIPKNRWKRIPGITKNRFSLPRMLFFNYFEFLVILGILGDLFLGISPGRFPGGSREVPRITKNSPQELPTITKNPETTKMSKSPKTHTVTPARPFPFKPTKFLPTAHNGCTETAKVAEFPNLNLNVANITYFDKCPTSWQRS
jgi:hypothetical protein